MKVTTDTLATIIIMALKRSGYYAFAVREFEAHYKTYIFLHRGKINMAYKHWLKTRIRLAKNTGSTTDDIIKLGISNFLGVFNQLVVTGVPYNYDGNDVQDKFDEAVRDVAMDIVKMYRQLKI